MTQTPTSAAKRIRLQSYHKCRCFCTHAAAFMNHLIQSGSGQAAVSGNVPPRMPAILRENESSVSTSGAMSMGGQHAATAVRLICISGRPVTSPEAARSCWPKPVRPCHL